MHDIKAIRDNPQGFDQGLARRGLAPMSGAILAIDQEKRDLIVKLQEAQSKRNALSKDIGDAMKTGEKARAEQLKAEVAALKDFIASGEEGERSIAQRMTDVLAAIPNIPFDEVPDGVDETGNVEVRRWGNRPGFNFAAKQHFELGEQLGQMDFEAASRMSGARFVLLRKDLARMERAIANLMLDMHTTKNGYIEHYVPLLVNDQTMFGTAQLPKFRDDQFQTTDGRWLTPTAEVTLTNSVREQILDESSLPPFNCIFAVLSRRGRSGRA
jgi:seryl-tRNA synthetase